MYIFTYTPLDPPRRKKNEFSVKKKIIMQGIK